MQQAANADAVHAMPCGSAESQSTAPTPSNALSVLELEAIVRGIPGALICADERLHIVVFSPRAQTMFGHEAIDILGKPLTSIIRDFADVIRRPADGDSTRDSARPFVGIRLATGMRATGELFPIEATISSAFVGNRSLTMILARDLAGRRRSEAAREAFEQRVRTSREITGQVMNRIGDTAHLRTAQTASRTSRPGASKLLDGSIAVVAHDLRNFVTAVGLTIGRIQQETDAGRRAELAQLAGESLDGMRRMVADLVDVGSIDADRLAVKMQRVDPIVLLVEAEALFKPMLELHGIEFRLDVPNSLPDVMADRERIFQVLGNLLSNAGKVTSRGGRVNVSAHVVDDVVLFAVRDTGRGIPQAHLPHVFDRFWRAQVGDEPRGTGLGLAIVKGIVQSHGGTVHATSVEGKGATFWFSLTVATTKEQPKCHPFVSRS